MAQTLYSDSSPEEIRLVDAFRLPSSRPEPKRPTYRVTRSARDKSFVESTGRVLAILEYFNTVRRSASEREIVRALEFPQSSTSALLHTMVDLGCRPYQISERVVERWRFRLPR